MFDKLFEVLEFNRISVDFKSAYRYTPKVLNNFVNYRKIDSLVYVVEGRYVYTCEGKEITVNEGSILYLPSNCKDYSYRIASEEAFTKQIDFTFSDKFSGKLFSLCDTPFIILNKAEHDLSEIFDKLSNISDRSDPSSKFIKLSLMYDLLSRIIRSNQNEHTDLRRIAPALEYMENNYHAEIYASELAELCKVSESHLRNLFKSVLGTTPIAYLNNLRINRAKNMLVYSGLTVTEIAYSLGYDDVYAFSHAFKKVIGVSPKKYAATRLPDSSRFKSYPHNQAAF